MIEVVISESEPRSSVIERAVAADGAIGRFRRAVIVAVFLVLVVGIVVLGRPPDIVVLPQSAPTPVASISAEIPADLLHSWQRPYAVAPGQDEWATGFLILATESLDYGPQPGTSASKSAVAVAIGGLNTLVVTATVRTRGCAIGAVGTYRWSLEGKGTVMTLTSIGPDACAARQTAIAGPWVRSDLPVNEVFGAILPSGTHLTAAFDPFRNPAASGQLSYAVPEGWTVVDDQPASFGLHHFVDNMFILFLAQPRLAAEIEPGASCGPFSEAPGVGHGLDDIVGSIVARPGVESTLPAPMTIGGYESQILDLNVAPSWTGGCRAPEGPIVGIPLLLGAGSETGPTIGVTSDHPVRLILLDLTNGRTMSIVIFNPDASQAFRFEEQVAAVMPVVESFRFHAPTE